MGLLREAIGLAAAEVAFAAHALLQISGKGVAKICFLLTKVSAALKTAAQLTQDGLEEKAPLRRWRTYASRKRDDLTYDLGAGADRELFDPAR